MLDLPTAKLSLADIEQRQQEMAKMKQLLFYQELKKRRQNKIKSKSYRRMLRKGKVLSFSLLLCFVFFFFCFLFCFLAVFLQ
jgi:U3 small nucleolar RNA-associated protein 14